MEILDLKEEVINKRSGAHHIRLDQKEKLDKKLKELRIEGILDKYDMTYSMMEEEHYISLCFYKSLDYLL